MYDSLKPYLTGIDHVGIAVPDLDEGIAFYRDVMGFELEHVETNEIQGTREAMLRAPGDNGTGSAMQLLAPLGPDTPIGKFLDRRGPGVQQLALRVTDIEAAAKALRSKGIHVLYDKPKPGTENSLTNFIHPKDTGGVLIELVEPAPRR
jgi:methylmalonyl-CoA/ethylmalonyl-CoA epimerase